MRKLLIPFLLTIFLCNGTTVNGADPCSFLNSVETYLGETKGGLKNTIMKICDRLHSLITDDYFTKLEKDEEGVYFARRVGFFNTLNCSLDPPDNLERIGMFGVGDTFFPKRKGEFYGETYFYGITRSGLYALIRKKDFIKMNTDMVYLFNRDYQPVNYCTNQTQCGGIGKEINPRYHFAATSQAEFDDNNDGRNCVTLNVDVFNANNDTPAESLIPEYNNSQLKYCYKNKDNLIFSNSHSEAKSNFDKLPVVGQYMILANDTLKQKIPFLITRKDCGSRSVLKKSTRVTLGGGLALGTDASIFTLEGKVDIGQDFVVYVEDIYDVNTQYIINNYSTIDNFSDFVKKKRNREQVINDIVISQKCDTNETIPMELNEVKINVTPAQKQVISIKADLLHEKAREYLGGKNVGAWINSTEKLNGKTWIIASLEQQRLWHDFIFNRIKNELRNILPKDIDNSQRNEYTYYYTALFMATVFEYVSADESYLIKKPHASRM